MHHLDVLSGLQDQATLLQAAHKMLVTAVPREAYDAERAHTATQIQMLEDEIRRLRGPYGLNPLPELHVYRNDHTGRVTVLGHHATDHPASIVYLGVGNPGLDLFAGAATEDQEIS